MISIQRLCVVFLLLLSGAAAPTTDKPNAEKLGVGEAKKLKSAGRDWSSSDKSIATVYKNGWVIALKPGDATISAGGDAIAHIHVVTLNEQMVSSRRRPSQYPDNRSSFTCRRKRGKCVGSELNSKIEGNAGNRVVNPKPIGSDKLQWELTDPTPVVDGAGMKMGTVALKSEGDRRVPACMFNYGMSKVMNGKLWLYAFSVNIKVDATIQPFVDAKDVKNGEISTSAWVPLDCVVNKETLLDLIGIGEGKLPKLPLDKQKYRITGGDPQEYLLPDGKEVSIVPPTEDNGPVPSHYLRRPSGTVNVIYSIPGFGLGGQGLDSFIINGNAIFSPAKGAKQFVQPTYFSTGPQKGKATGETMTFLYGAVEVPGSETVYGWVAKEALAAER